MSQPNTQQERKPAPEKNSYQEAVALMRRMGSKQGFNPIPPSQHERMMGKDQDPFVRVWGAMLHFTIGWGHRSPYAVDKDGKEMHSEHFAQLLDMDRANVEKYLGEGVESGYWRKGTKGEGNRRWYLCGEVPQFQEEPKDQGQKSMRRLFPAYILNALNKLPSERVAEFWAEHKADAQLENRLRADVDEARRTLFAHRQDTRLRAFSLPEIRRQEHTPKDPKEAAGRVELRERVHGLLPLLAPLVEKYAHTFSESAQTSENGSRTVEKNNAQSERTLLPLESGIERRGEPQASESSEALVSRPVRGAISNQSEKFGYLPAAEVTVSEWIKNPRGPYPPIPTEAGIEACRRYPEAAQTLFFQFSHIKDIAKDPAFTEFSEDRKTDQILVGRIILTTGAGPDPNRAMQFVLEVAAKFKGLGRGAMGKLQGRAPGQEGGPHTFGLILTWAGDFAKTRAKGAGAHA